MTLSLMHLLSIYDHAPLNTVAPAKAGAQYRVSALWWEVIDQLFQLSVRKRLAQTRMAAYKVICALYQMVR